MQMSLSKKCVVASMIVFSLNGAVSADPNANKDQHSVAGGQFSTWVEFASDYVFRGESETNDGEIPSLKGQITWTHKSGFYSSFYMANVLFPGESQEASFKNPEINAVYGLKIGTVINNIADSGINYNGSLFQYMYPGDNKSNYLEMFNFVDKQFNNVNVSLEFSPTLTEWFGTQDLMSFHVAAHVSVALPDHFTVSASVGHQGFDYSGDEGYEDIATLDWRHWNLGVSRPLWGFVLDLRYYDTNLNGYHAFYGTNTNANQIMTSRVVVALSQTW